MWEAVAVGVFGVVALTSVGVGAFLGVERENHQQASNHTTVRLVLLLVPVVGIPLLAEAAPHLTR